MKRITIIGGGLAGLTLGIGLRHHDVPVSVWEAGHYPRHRVCGEFINGRGQSALKKLRLFEKVQNKSVLARTAVFVSRKANSPIRPLPQSALCVSRFVLDSLLAKEFTEAGGELRQGQRWQEPPCQEGVVRATGRRSQSTDNGWRWFGLKAHATNVRLIADVEMHLQSNGYVGMCRVDSDRVNVCGLFRRSRKKNDHPLAGWQQLLRGSGETMLHRRLADADFDTDSFCAVAGLSFRSERHTTSGECCIGDSIAMIPPVTGNGMSMAFESAEIAIEPLVEYSRGLSSWSNARQKIASSCDRIFGRRLQWARWLQWMMFTPCLKNGIGTLALRSGWLWQLFLLKTR